MAPRTKVPISKKRKRGSSSSAVVEAAIAAEAVAATRESKMASRMALCVSKGKKWVSTSVDADVAAATVDAELNHEASSGIVGLKNSLAYRREWGDE
ncbi:uncharacterized protein A4U43_C09F11280 [Asparagus officinalis]|uniref:Uncharacterized protein n=1 Tax=Asparagus officinalis TaxID=4686 RepID=A0A5P1E714_ASPOF|nr:uncharacterized protein A4U43_C09F11280 [Asparagus officinalis]